MSTLTILPEGDDAAEPDKRPPPARSPRTAELVAPQALTVDDRRRILRSSLTGIGTGLVLFVCVLWDWRLAPLRRAGAHGFASNFYDIQARALLDGHLWVPDRSLGIEGFVIDGRTYMYFPPLPALLRLPVLMVTDRFDGRLTAPFMILAWLVFAAATAALLWSTRLLIRGHAAVTRTEAWVGGIFLASVTGGSVILFLAALPWVYHEAYLWAAATSVAALAGLIRFAMRPTTGVAVATAALAAATVLTRTTTGWALAATVATVGAVAALRNRHGRVAPALILVGGGAVAVLAGAAVNWAKFRHPYMFPLEHQEWTAVSSRRRLALMVNGGTITGPQFLRSSLVNYFRPDGIRFVPYFPFITFPAEPAHGYGGAVLDQMYRTGSVPAFNPLLAGVTLVGVVGTVRARLAGVRGLLVPVFGAITAGGGVMLYGYIAYRYCADFVPALAICGAVGVVVITRWLEPRPRRSRRVAGGLLLTLAIFGAAANGAAAVATARTTWRGEPLRRFLSVQQGLGDPFGRSGDLVTRSPALPAGAAADSLQVINDCEALYLATGDQYEPWVAVEVRELRMAIRASALGFHPGLVPLIRFDGAATRDVTLESDDRGRIRFRVGEGDFFYPTDWYELGPGERIEVDVRIDTTLDRFYLVFDGIAERDWHVNASDADAQQVRRVTRPVFMFPPAADQLAIGLSLMPAFGPPPELCDRLLDDLA